MRKITAVSALMTEDCNLACTFCFELGKHRKAVMSEETIKGMLNMVFNNARINRHEYGDDSGVNIMVFGGEPFLSPEGLKTLYLYGKELSDLYRVPFGGSIVTNGTVLGNDIAKFFESYAESLNFSFQISLEGVKRYNDLSRHDLNGKGSYDMVVKNLPKFKKMVEKKNDRGALHIHSSLDRKTLPGLEEAYFHFTQDLGVPQYWAMPIHDEWWTDEDVKSYETQLTNIAKYIMSQQNWKELLHDYAPLNKALENGGVPSKPCGAGCSFMTVTADGSLYPCHQIYTGPDGEQSYIGNVWDGVDEDRIRMFEDYDTRDMVCEEKNCTLGHCYRCIADTYRNTGCFVKDNMKKLSNRCEMSMIEDRLIRDIKERVRR